MGHIYHFKNELAKALLIPFVILLAIAIFANPKETALGWNGLIGLLALIAYVFMVITTHRIILLGKGSVPKWGIYKITMREIWFVLYLFGIFAISLPAVVFAFVPVIGIALFVIVPIYILSRFSLVLPSIAIDQRLSFLESWRMTKKHQLLMLAVVGIFPTLVEFIITLIAYIPYIEITVIPTILSILTLVCTVSTLSVAFKMIIEDEYKEE